MVQLIAVLTDSPRNDCMVLWGSAPKCPAVKQADLSVITHSLRGLWGIQPGQFGQDGIMLGRRTPLSRRRWPGEFCMYKHAYMLETDHVLFGHAGNYQTL